MLCISLTYENEIHVQTPAGEAIIRLSDEQPKVLHKVRLIFEAPRDVTIFRETNSKRLLNASPDSR